MTVLVKYKEWVKAPHPQLNGRWEPKAKILIVEDITKINDMFECIEDIKVLQCGGCLMSKKGIDDQPDGMMEPGAGM